MYDILVVDDERWIRKGIVKMIDGKGTLIGEIMEADSVEGAEELFDQKHPHIIISDVKFPKEDGCILCRRIYLKSPETKIIMLSGYDDFEYVKSALSYKAVDYLLKPVAKEALNDAIRRGIEEICASSRRLGVLEGEGAGEPSGSFLSGFSSGREESGNVDGIIHQVIEDIRSRYYEKLSLSDISEQYHVSEAYFSSMFKKCTGTTLMNYLMEYRIEKAKELMMTTDRKIVEIAQMVGYADIHYFNKVFKKVTGEAPRDCKKKLMEELKGEDSAV